MRTRLEVFQRLDSRFRGNDKQGGNDEGDAFPRSPYPKLGLPMRTPSTTDFLMMRRWTARGFYPIFHGALRSSFSLESDLRDRPGRQTELASFLDT